MLRPRQQAKLARGAKDEKHAMSYKLDSGIAVIGIGKRPVTRALMFRRSPSCRTTRMEFRKERAGHYSLIVRTTLEVGRPSDGSFDALARCLAPF